MKTPIRWYLTVSWFLLAGGALAEPPLNDHLGQATLLQGSAVEFAADLTEATRESAESIVDMEAPAPTASVWWVWRAEVDGEVLVDTAMNPLGFNARVGHFAVCEGDRFEALRVLDWNITGDTTRACVFRARAGQVYSIRVAAYAPDGRWFVGGRAIVRGQLRVTRFPAIIQQPAHVPLPIYDAAIRERGALLTVYAVDGPNQQAGFPDLRTLRYQWLNNGIAMEGRTNSFLYFEHTYPSRAGDYQVVVSGISGSVTSAVARISFHPSPGYLSASVEATRDPAGRPVVIFRGNPGQLYKTLHSHDLVNWYDPRGSSPCSYNSVFAMPEDGLRWTPPPSIQTTAFFRLVEADVTDFPINQHFQLIHYRIREESRKVRSSTFFPEGMHILDPSSNSWETGGLGPSRIGELYNVWGGNCITATLPAAVGLGFYARGGTMYSEWDE